MSCVAVFGDEHLAIGSAQGVRQFTLNGSEIGWMWDDGDVPCMAPIPPHLEICGEEGPIFFIGDRLGAFVHNFYGGTVLELPHDTMIWSVCVFPDGSLATGDDDGCARVFDCYGDLLWETSYSGSVFSMCVLPNGNLFKGGADGAYILSSSGLYLVKLTDDRVSYSCVLPNGNVCVLYYPNVARVYKLDSFMEVESDKNDLDTEYQQDQNDIAEEQEDEFGDVVGEVDSCSQGS